MIVHLLLFRPRHDLTSADRAALKAAIDEARRDIPGIRRFLVGRRPSAPDRYPGLPDRHLEYAALLEFDEERSLDAYLEHPAHRELAARFRSDWG